MHSERPQRVLVRSDATEVLPVPVHAEHVTELAVVDQLLELDDCRVVEQQMAGHEDEVALRRERDELVDLVALHRGRLLDEHVLAGLERPLREVVVRRHRSRDHDRVQRCVLEHLVEGRRPAGVRVAALELRILALGRIAEPGEVGEVGEVARQILPPLSEAGLPDPDAHSFQTLSECVPFLPVALRRSTTRTASSTSCS